MMHGHTNITYMSISKSGHVFVLFVPVLQLNGR